VLIGSILCQSVLYSSLDSLRYGRPWAVIFVLLVIFLIFFFLLVNYMLSNYIKVAVFRLECTLRHVRFVWGRLRVVTASLLDLILCDLKYSQVFGEIFHGEGVLGWKVFDLLHRVHSRIKLGENFAKLDVIKFLYIYAFSGSRYNYLPPLKSLKIRSWRRKRVL